MGGLKMALLSLESKAGGGGGGGDRGGREWVGGWTDKGSFRACK